jgi:soluble lytic murein transglycosylase
MTRSFWESLFPLPWGDELIASAAPHELDPYVVAGLIRQESEFNPGARSHAGAMGLMQIMPATGRGLAQRLGIQSFSTGHLYRPELSLRLGTFHLKQVFNRYQNELEISLAAYNAGEHRAAKWIEWGDFDEPGKFVETIPFTETRGYVQSVMRNADIYRRLYGGDPIEQPSVASADEE